MIFLIIFILLLLSIIFPKSRLICFCMFLFMWQLWGWNSWNGDYDNYKLIFNTVGRFGFKGVDIEEGYSILNWLCYGWGLDFQEFMILYSFIVLSLTYLFVSRSRYPAFLSVLYFIIFVMEFVFMRNYMADSLFLLTVLIAFSSVKRRLFKSVVLLFIALSFHYSALMYFAFMLIYIPKLNLRRLFYLIVCSVLVLFTSLTFFLSFVSTAVIKSKIAYYSKDINPIGPTIGHLLIVASLVLFILNSQKYVQTLSDKVRNNIDIIAKINIISLIYIPLYFYFPNFSRFFKVLFVLDLFFLLYLFYYYSLKQHRMVLTSILIGIYLIIIYQFAYSTLEYTYFPLINSNLIFSNI